MRAAETTVKALLDGQKQYVIPLFQRKYSWRPKHWEALWQDILELYAMDSTQDHFLGSIVTLSQDGSPESITPYTLIDGQQRLTTLCLLISAIRDTCRESDPDIAERLHGLYLTNQYASGEDEFKVLPTQVDREAFFAVILRSEPMSGSGVSEAYQFFRAAIRKGDDDEQPLDPSRLEGVVLTKLSLVSITLGKDDNPYRIFESLNAKGLPLTQSDLLRNYFFMRLPVAVHEALYTQVWKPLNDRLGKRLEEFIRDFLVKDGDFVRGSDVYQEWKARLDDMSTDEVQSKLKQLGKFGTYYANLIEPEREQDADVSVALRRLNRWGMTTIYPFILNLYEDVAAGRLSRPDLSQILKLVESFLVRRMFANVPTNALNRIFIRLYSQLPARESILEATREALSSPGLRWPTDDQFVGDVVTYPLYLDSRPDQRKLVLETLEESFSHPERVDLSDLTIEHVMPQTLTDEWRRWLGENSERIHRDYLHTLGNLTLTGYNQALSNHPFERKQQLLHDSHLELNREIADEETWTDKQIVRRAKRLAARAVEIWPGPNALTATDVVPSDDTGDRELSPEVQRLLSLKDELLAEGTAAGKAEAKRIRKILRNDHDYYISRERE